jgi:DNA gyrase subunit B
VLEGDNLAALVRLTAKLEDALVTRERRGLGLATVLAQADDRGVLPLYRVRVGGREWWKHTADEVDELRRKEEEKLGRELVAGDEALASNGHANGNGASAAFDVIELHEVKEINRALEELRRQGLSASDLVPAPRVAGREPPPRLVLENGEQKWALAHLRDLVADVRRLGERGLAVTRFKGLGEMDPEELWETTLDPDKRTLMQVQLDDALKADEMFRTLMGEKVEPRRDFIQKYALEVKEIDYHGA